MTQADRYSIFFQKLLANCKDLNVILRSKAKKKYFVSKLARNFQTDAACGFFFFILFIFYFNWPLPPRTSETKNDWKVSTSVFSEIKQDFTRFLSSHVLTFFQNSKLSSFFVVKMKKKKKNKFKKKKWKSEFLQNQMHTEKQMRAAALRHRIFFFSLIQNSLKTQRKLSFLVELNSTLDKSNFRPSLTVHIGQYDLFSQLKNKNNYESMKNYAFSGIFTSFGFLVG